MRYHCVLVIGAVAASAMVAACSGDDGGTPRRVVEITQTDDACTPASIDLKPGEKVTFKVKNDGKKDREIEGIEGMKLEEVLVPSGRTRQVGFSAPSAAGTLKLKCYTPGGAETVIAVNITP